jgi:hypothetical protein
MREWDTDDATEGPHAVGCEAFALVVVERRVDLAGVVGLVRRQLFGAREHGGVLLFELFDERQQLRHVGLGGLGQREGERQFVVGVDDEVELVAEPLGLRVATKPRPPRRSSRAGAAPRKKPSAPAASTSSPNWLAVANLPAPFETPRLVVGCLRKAALTDLGVFFRPLLLFCPTDRAVASRSWGLRP